ncbi:unnamed protein product, partial [Larinioides sclopetarius]
MSRIPDKSFSVAQDGPERKMTPRGRTLRVFRHFVLALLVTHWIMLTYALASFDG